MGCTGKTEVIITDSTSIPAPIIPTGLTISANSTVANTSNVNSFDVSGTCASNDSITLTAGFVTKSVSCSGGSWATTINLAGLSDGSITVNAVSGTNPSQTAQVAVTKATAPTCAGGPTVFSTNMNARYVIGQADFVSYQANRGGAASASTLNVPIGIAIYNGKLYIADAGNNRVLVYNTIPTASNVAADAVIGQPNFTSTASGTTASSLNGIQSIASDGTYLAISEWSNARVSFWPIANPTSASFFWGQPNGTSNTVNNGGRSATSMGAAAGLAYLNGKFYVGDVSNYRVLGFDAASISTGQAANRVIGQTDFVTAASTSGAGSMGYPFGLSTEGTHLVVVDGNEDALKIFNTVPTSNGAAADVVWGGYGINNLGLNNPVGAYIGADGKFFVADRGSDRVLVFNSVPTSAAQAPDYVIGQPNFNTGDHNQCNCNTPGQNTLSGVHHVVWDGCRLYVTDRNNSRVLIY